MSQVQSALTCCIFYLDELRNVGNTSLLSTGTRPTSAAITS
ncbi:hypothetical protein BTN49_2903 [Candidatus Enterovibrio escicola]|uniref:Uncharacterized protein n=1 Tax=Candidatus Enterovibrio escicola TaxID=1927127 RepID=A0A2A5SZM3_9GAMM|nr:hypothetical protein BTN49_2903 [Candidatus Enterovibrio escacola]